MPEVAGKSGILVNPSSTEEITDAMIDITENPIVREQLVSNCAEQSKKFSWDISSERFYEIIQKEISTKVDN
jgi:glycosyltransferase involved in cell wall biosynthesis